MSTALAALLLAAATHATALEPEVQARVDEAVKSLAAWGRAPVIVNAVKAQNAQLPAEHAAMTQDKWKVTSVLDPFIRGLTKNEVAAFLKANKDDAVSEAFVCDANGLKVGFLGKTSSWSHKGGAKHEVPMTGKTWQGEVEVDESSGIQQVQVAIPVMDGDQPIGSITIGLALRKLGE